MTTSSQQSTSRPQACAIYTRRSVGPDPHQDFNSLEGQRAICSAYVTSQRHKGWLELSKHYDDAGRSGASLNRPQLQDLLADIERGLIDVVVVYKLDRMTRTLLDFVRLVDFFERHGIVFVSITQNFDTADSMGRLVLNVLLTFAQFEREMAADRIRDKILVTKQSGRWAGGPAPLGYDLMRHRLHVNEWEARIVRQIFNWYIELQNLTHVYNECREAGYTSKRWRTRAGHMAGGGPITKALVFHVLGNPIYIGEIRHRHETYQGLQAPIIDRDTWDKVQQIRAVQARKKAHRNKDHVLTDVLFDCFGRPMSVQKCEVPGKSVQPSRYYMSRQNAWGKRQGLKRLRARADQIEELVIAAISSFLANREQIRSILLSLSYHDKSLDRLARSGHEAGKRLSIANRDRLGSMLRTLVVRIELSLERVKIVLRLCEIERFLSWDGVGIFRGNKADWPRTKTHMLDMPAGAIRYHRQLAIPVRPRSGAPTRHPSPALRRLIHEARQVQSLVDQERGSSLAELAAQMKYTQARFARVLRLNYLAPDIIMSILDGTHPAGLTRTNLVNANLPMDWALQRRLFGFPDRAGPEGGE